MAGGDLFTIFAQLNSEGQPMIAPLLNSSGRKLTRSAGADPSVSMRRLVATDLPIELIADWKVRGYL